MRRVIVPVVALVLAGCASNYVYRPEENATATVAGHAAARYEVPPEQPQGDVRVASFGVSKITPEGSGEQLRALHVRMIVANNSQVPWTIDTRKQQAVLDSGEQLTAAFARADVEGLPVVTVPPSGQRTIDLFYPLPLQVQKASRIPGFGVMWRVDTGGGREVVERTPFERLRVEPAYAYGYGYGWGYDTWGLGPYDWSNPFWGPYPYYSGGSVTIGRPTWHGSVVVRPVR